MSKQTAALIRDSLHIAVKALKEIKEQGEAVNGASGLFLSKAAEVALIKIDHFDGEAEEWIKELEEALKGLVAVAGPIAFNAGAGYGISMDQWEKQDKCLKVARDVLSKKDEGSAE